MFSAIFEALKGNIFSWIASSNYKNIFIFKFIELFELMTMCNFSSEKLDSFKSWDHWIRIMTCCNNDVIKSLNTVLIC